MSTSRLLPHLVADPESVQWGAWWVEVGGRRELVTERLKGWDYSSQVKFEIQPTVDVERVLQSVGLSDASEVSLVGLVDCKATGQRFTAATSLAELATGGSNLVAIQPSVGEIADSVELSAHLVFAGQGVPNAEGRAWRPGSRLGTSSVTRLRLEGSGARFPTEAVSFKALGLEPAAWSLTFSPDELDDSFMGHVRLLVNTDHPASDVLLSHESPTALAVQNVLLVDVARQMFVRVALSHHAFDGPWSEGSIGHSLDVLARQVLSMDLRTVSYLVRRDFALFERKLQVGFELLREVS